MKQVLVYYTPGGTVPFKITGRLDHTWFLTVFGQEEQGEPYNVQQFMDFVNEKYDKDATFEMDYHGTVKCKPILKFTEMDTANKFLEDFKQLLKKA